MIQQKWNKRKLAEEGLKKKRISKLNKFFEIQALHNI